MEAAPPGPSGLPVIGNAQRFIRDPLSFLETCSRAYGDIAKFSVGPDDAYLIMNPADIERVLVREADGYRKPEFQQGLNEALGDGLLLNEGNELWSNQRRRSQPAFGMSRFTQPELLATMARCTENVLEGWRDGDVVPVEYDMARITIKIVGNLLFDVDLDEGVVRTIIENLEPLGNEFEMKIERVLMPPWVPTRTNREFQQSVDTLRRVLRDVVRERQRRNPDSDWGNGQRDFLSIMLQAQNETSEVDRELVRDELMTMLLAGHDTTSLALMYTWYLLAGHPEIEAKLHQELDTVLGGTTPTAEDLRNLEYTERVLKEAMRLYPPVHMLVREPQTDVQLAGYNLPEGSTLLLPQWAVHRDPRWYDEPEKFDPDRWKPERTADRPRLSYFPFGAGLRQCIGEPLAMIETKLVVSTIAQRYRLERTSDEPLTINPAVTIHPDTSPEMRVQER